MRMFELVPVPVITDFLLVLFTKSLFSYACVPLLKPFMAELQPGDLGKAIPEGAVDNGQLRDVNEAIRSHAIEQVGKKLRGYMTDMKRIAVAG